jgi:hypothetical protein
MKNPEDIDIRPMGLNTPQIRTLVIKIIERQWEEFFKQAMNAIPRKK